MYNKNLLNLKSVLNVLRVRGYVWSKKIVSYTDVKGGAQRKPGNIGDRPGEMLCKNDCPLYQREPTLIDLGGNYSYQYRKDGDNKIRVGVIGAGPAGMAVIRHCLNAGDMEVTCFEQLHTVGGIWNYNEKTGSDETGTPYHSYIYKDLVTNLPKETMMYPDFPYSDDVPESYVCSSEVAKYLKSYADLHNLEAHIKFRHRVTHVKPLSNRWSLTALDITSNHERVLVFDAIFVCSGPLVLPVYPDVGQARFSGTQIHSKDYRIPDGYKDKVVLVIGLGPSGLDLAYQISPFARQVYLSSNRGSFHIELPTNVAIKPEVNSIEDKTINFKDGSCAQIDSIIHCTGYTYNYPFLDSECGVTVDKYVFPLYKHFISIEKPNLFFIGLLRPISHLFMCDFQIRVAVKVLKAEVNLPSKEDMMTEWKNDITARETKGNKKHTFHQIGGGAEQYFHDLAQLGNLDPIPPVQIGMFQAAYKKSITDFLNFRKYAYRIKSDSDFEVVKLK